MNAPIFLSTALENCSKIIEYVRLNKELTQQYLKIPEHVSKA